MIKVLLYVFRKENYDREKPRKKFEKKSTKNFMPRYIFFLTAAEKKTDCPIIAMLFEDKQKMVLSS